MRYMLLIYSEEVADGPPPDPAEMKKWGDYTAEFQASGAMLAGEALQPSGTATTVRVRDGKPLVSDGPFAETKEVLGGYYLLDVETLDEALDWAAKCPAAPYGSIEIRPIMEIPEGYDG